MLSYSIVVFHLSFNFLCLLLLYSIYLCGQEPIVGIGLLYRPARLHWLAGRYDNSVLIPLDCSKFQH